MVSIRVKNMNNFMIDVLVGVIDWLVVCLLTIREWLCPSPPDAPIVYTGGEPILPDDEVMKVQPALIALVGEKKATILQKVHEWVQVNKKKGTHTYKGETWTYGSYQDWHERHFDWFTPKYLGKLFSQLVADGYLVAVNDAPFCYKGQHAYRVNYGSILQVVVVDKVVEPIPKSHLPLPTNGEGVSDKVGYNNVVIQSTLNNPFKDKQTNKLLDKFREVDGFDVDVVVDKPKHDSGVFENLSAEALTDTSEFLALEDGIGTPDSTVVDDLCRWFAGMTAKTATHLAAQYEEGWLRTVASYTREQKQLTNPVGFLISELKTNRLGLKDASPVAAETDYTGGEWASIIKA